MVDAPKNPGHLGARARHRLASPAEASPKSRRRAIVVVQRAAQALAPLDHACVSQMARLRADESIRQPLVIALDVIMRGEVVNRGPQRILSKQDHSLQAGFLDGLQESLGVRIQIWRSW